MSEPGRCPFCGSDDVRFQGNAVETPPDLLTVLGGRIECNDCASAGPYASVPESETRYADAKEAAIKLWNTRGVKVDVTDGAIVRGHDD